jgi:DNA end-binding protein Ku
MAARPAWKGFLRLSLVSVPVRAYTASATGQNEIHLNQLHAECNSRIQYKKNCPVHGEVTNDEIVSGYQYAKGQYVLIDTDELEKLRTESDRAIKIDCFIDPKDVDPLYHTGRTYYLVPDGPVGHKPYDVLRRAMLEEKRHAIAQTVMSGKEQLVLVRPLDGLLALTVLAYDEMVKKPAGFQDEAPPVEATPEELNLAKMLIRASTSKKFDVANYKDEYTAKLTKLIRAKIEGEEIVAPPAETETPVINLMDALRESVARSQAAGASADKPPRRMAPSRGPASTIKRKKKTG